MRSLTPAAVLSQPRAVYQFHLPLPSLMAAPPGTSTGRGSMVRSGLGAAYRGGPQPLTSRGRMPG